MKYPYFRGLEADRYSFYRVPKALIKVDLFEKMSGDAKLLYAVLLDRMNLSLKNGWQDENGNAYIKSIGFSLEDGSIYSGMFDLMVGGEVQAEVVNHIQHYRESPLVQKAILDMKTLLEKRQASKELEERPNTRQSVREALKNRKKAQEQQSNQEQAKPKKAKKKGEIEL